MLRSMHASAVVRQRKEFEPRAAASDRLHGSSAASSRLEPEGANGTSVSCPAPAFPVPGLCGFGAQLRQALVWHRAGGRSRIGRLAWRRPKVKWRVHEGPVSFCNCVRDTPETPSRIASREQS